MKKIKSNLIPSLIKKELTPKYIGDCVCPCHIDPIHVIHPVPCCAPCPYCGKKIARGLQKKHETHCKRKNRNV